MSRMHRIIWVVLIQSLTILLVAGANQIIQEQSIQNNNQNEATIAITAAIKKIVTLGISPVKNYYGWDAQINPKLLSPKCHEDLLYMKDVFGVNHTSYSPTPFWQEHMIDSNGRLPAGVIEGNVFWMGDFEQCTTVKVWKNTHTADTTKKDTFQGKYCLPNINHYIEPFTNQFVEPLPIAATVGICLPSTCTASEIETLFNELLYPVHFIIEEKLCLTSEPHQVDDWTFYATILFASIAALVIVATICDLLPYILKPLQTKNRSKESPVKRQGIFTSVLMCFSGYSNTKKLFDTSHRNETMPCINGLRAMSMILVVAGHMIAMTLVMSNGRHNPLNVIYYVPKLWAQPVLYGTYTVDTFFCLTGYLVSYGAMSAAVQMRGRFNILYFYLHRMWRLTPTYMLLTIFAAGPFHLTFTGPLWISSPFFNTTTCRANLWKTPLYIEIYTDVLKPIMCMPHTWYLNAEMTLYIFSGIILYPMIKKHWSATLVCIVAIVASISTVAILAHTKNMENVISYYIRGFNVKEFGETIYIKPWGRASPFIIGLTFGYFYFKKGKDLKFSARTLAVTWTLTAIGMLGCIFINYPFVNGYYTSGPSHIYNVAHISLSTAVWGTCIGWIILACSTNHGGIVNTILSWKFLVPIGRLSFCAYIVHFEVLTNFGSSRKQALYSDVYLMYYCLVALNLVTTVIAVLLCISIEAPTIQLETLMIKAAKKKDVKKITSNGKSIS